MTEFEYIREEDRLEYRDFCIHHLRSFERRPVDEIWHYTNADGLLGILKSGQIWATQVACLNDNLEKKYFSTLICDAVKERRRLNSNQLLDDLWRIADERLSNADFSAEGQFVACFSEVEDDLGQWRGYGGGECGYAIGFKLDKILEAIKSRPNSVILPLHYEEIGQKFLVDQVMEWGERYYTNGLEREPPDKKEFAALFFEAFAEELDIFSSLIKHPKFSGEKEWRIATGLMPDEHKFLEFRQKRTLLARHLPINITIHGNGVYRLPLTRIYVGPGASQNVSRVSVGDLLLKHKYDNIKVEKSKIPYRVP